MSHGVVIPHSETQNIMGSEKKMTEARSSGLRISHVSCSPNSDTQSPQAPQEASSLLTRLTMANPAGVGGGGGMKKLAGKRCVKEGVPWE
jgi:hypothetical protein